MQKSDEINAWYVTKDPWKYATTPDDLLRKKKILGAIPGKYYRALDIGAGEGWITKDLPAEYIYGYEISENATHRFPANVRLCTEPIGMYDLILATGVMYPQYDYKKFVEIIKDHANGIVILCNIKEWEVPEVASIGTPLYSKEFDYREYKQVLRVYDFSTPNKSE